MATTPKKKPPAKKAPAKKAPVKKAPSGTLTERMGEVKSRPNKGLPARIGQTRGNLNKANPPKEIRLGGQGGTGRSLTTGKPPAKFQPVPLGERPKLLSGPSGKAAKSPLGGIIRGGAVVTALTSIVNPGFMSYKTGGQAGPGSDKTSGPLFSPSKNRAAGKGNPKAVNPYKARTVGDKGVSKTVNPYRASKAPAETRSVTTPPYAGMNKGSTPKPESSAKDKMKRQQQGMKPDVRQPVKGKAKPSVAAPMPKARPSAVSPAKPKAMTFKEASRRNQSDQYIKNKMRPKGNLLDLIRRKK